MTLEERKHLIELFHAAFDLAYNSGLAQPVNLMYFGKYLRLAEPGFSHLNYGHEKLLYLLRDFPDVLFIKKEPSVGTPQFSVSVRKASSPSNGERRSAPSQVYAKLLEPQWVNGSVVEHYLDRLAQTTSHFHHRLDEYERQLEIIQREQEQSRANEARLNAKNLEHERAIAYIQKELEQSRANEIRLNEELKATSQKLHFSKIPPIKFSDYE